jgi:uncharacterized protein (TIGR03437 family)
VTTPTGSSAPFQVTVETVKPGLLAPSSFVVGGRQNLVALFPDNVTYVLPPGAIAGVPSRRARPGDTIVLYGVGFGNVTPNIVPGTLAQQSNTLSLPFALRIGGIQATVSYSGLAPNYVGLYQFNVVVPSVTTGDSVPVSFSLNGVASTQNLAIAIGN